MLQSVQAVNSLDWLVLFAFLIASFRNSLAFLQFACCTLYVLFFIFYERNFHAFISISCIYFFLIYQSFVKIPSSFCFAFSCFGVIYFAGAIDQFLYYHFDADTMFDRIQPYLITLVNAYLLAYLFSGWRRADVHGISYDCVKFIDWYKMYSLRIHQAEKQKAE